MTKKDYVLIAGALAQTRAGYTSSIAQRIVRDAAINIADALARDNERFDKARFLTAAGGEIA